MKTLRSLIKRAVLSLVGNDSGNHQTSQAQYWGKASDFEVIYPYGLCANPPKDSLILLLNVMAQEENKAGIANLHEQRFRNLKEGEVAVGNYLTRSVTKFLANGDIEIFSANDEKIAITNDSTKTVGGDMTVTVSGNVTLNVTGTTTVNNTDNITVNAPLTTFNGNVTINGVISADNGGGGDHNIIGDIDLTGTFDASVDVTTGGISLNSHTHGGVTTGAGSTGGPQ